MSGCPQPCRGCLRWAQVGSCWRGSLQGPHRAVQSGPERPGDFSSGLRASPVVWGFCLEHTCSHTPRRKKHLPSPCGDGVGWGVAEVWRKGSGDKGSGSGSLFALSVPQSPCCQRQTLQLVHGPWGALPWDPGSPSGYPLIFVDLAPAASLPGGAIWGFGPCPLQTHAPRVPTPVTLP